METKTFSISINAPKEKVWEVLWNDESYRQWTAVFSEGSYAVSDWQPGSKIHFLTPDGNGMYSTIERMVPNEVMSFRHGGEIINGVEQPPNEKTKSWEGATENYTLQDAGGQTLLSASMDLQEAAMPYFASAFPKALQKVKEIAES